MPTTHRNRSSATTSQRTKGNVTLALPTVEPAPYGQQFVPILQNDVYEGRRIDFTIPLPLCPDQLMGTTGYPFDIKVAITTRGATDSKTVDHTMMNILIPVQNLVRGAIALDEENYPRLGRNKDCIIFSLRGMSS